MSRSQPAQTELLVDTHVHTTYSDGIAGIPRIERFCSYRGLGLAITDHNEIRGAASIFERERLPVIPGIEVGTEEGVDLLVYFPSAELLEEMEIEPPDSLYGLYQGTPLTERGWAQGNVLPDRITLYQKPIEEDSEDHEDAIVCIAETLIHEIGHYFGLSEEEIEEIEERYWRGEDMDDV